MNTQEVNLDHFSGHGLCSNSRRNGGNESDHFFRRRRSDGAEPVRVPAGRTQSPLEKLRRVVEAEHVVVIFDVVLV